LVGVSLRGADRVIGEGRVMSRIWIAGAVLVGVAGLPAQAGVKVVPEAARSGTYGLRSEVRQGCSGEEATLILEPVVTDQRIEACREIVVGAEVHNRGRLVAVSGRRVVFTDGFRVEAGGSLVAGTNGAWDPGYVVDETPNGERRLFVRWYGRFDATGLEVGKRLTTLRLRGQQEVRAWVRYEAAGEGGWVWVDVAGEDGATISSARGWVSGGWHRLEVEWDSGNAIAPTGRVGLLLDGAAIGSIEGVALMTVLLDRVELGAIEADAPGGWLDLDDFATARQGPLGGVE
jgi:hypothetical protein